MMHQSGRLDGTVPPCSPRMEIIRHPSVEELQPQSDILTCEAENCGRTFQHVRALHFHMVKTHRVIKDLSDAAILKGQKVMQSESGVCCKFYCPEINCVNHKTSPFRSLKRLKEHYVNVHAEKKFVCPNCQLGFGYQRALKRHQTANCGLTYRCGSCTVEFNSKTAMQTHCKRKEHVSGCVIKDKYNTLLNNAEPTQTSDSNGAENALSNTVANAITETTAVRLGSCFGEEFVNSPTRTQKTVLDSCGDHERTTKSVGIGEPISGAQDSDCTNRSVGRVGIDEACTSSTQVDTCVGTEDMSTNIIGGTLDTCTDIGITVNQFTTAASSLPGEKNGAIAAPPGTSGGTRNQSSSQHRTQTPTTVVVNVMNVYCTDPSLPHFIKGRNGQRTIWPKAPKTTEKAGSGPNTCSTQTSGDFILEKAMRTARIEAKKVSIGSQVSPKSKQKSPKSMRSACVQTPAKKRNRIPVVPRTPLPSVDDIFCLSDVETQTNTLLEELQASLGASISTQTMDSFLATNPERLYSLPLSLHGTGPVPDIMTSSVTDPMAQNYGLLTDQNVLRLSPLDSNFGLDANFNTNQTQTMDSVFEQLLNDMETQTPFADFGFGIDNETQTVAPQSVETQTSLHGRGQTDGNVVSTSIETQTTATDFDPSLFEFAQLISGLQ